ncbi:ammonia monooxygenase [Herbaspirillum sp. RU 5E]|nr:ammonia monooxygenase [Herbaspirillum sp. RU 5E]
MTQLSKFLQQGAPGYLTFWCPGCDGPHTIKHDGPPGPNWTWNGSAEQPTFSPSVLVTGREFTEKGRADYQAWYDAGCPDAGGRQFESADTCCHSFVTSGQIQFLSDCTHEMAGKTAQLAEFPDGWGMPRQEVSP